MATKIIDELITLIGFKTNKNSDNAFKKVKTGIVNIRKAALVAGGTLAGLSFAIAKISKGVDQQAKFAAGIGISFENLQKLQFAAQRAGASSSELDSSLASLTRTMASTRPGEYNRTLLQLGITARNIKGELKPASVVLLEIADRFKSLSAIRRQQFGGQLGLSPRIINFLGQGSEKIAKDIREGLRIGAIIPGDLAANAAELTSDSLLKVKSTVKGLADTIALVLAPSLSGVLTKFDEWIILNKDVVESDIVGSLKAIGNAILFIGKAFDAVTVAIKPFIKGINAADNLLESLIKKSKFLTDIKSVFGKVNPFSVGIPQKIVSVPQSVSNNTENNASRNNINNTFNIKIDGASLPQETARKVVEEFELATAAQAASPGFNRPKVG